MPPLLYGEGKELKDMRVVLPDEIYSIEGKSAAALAYGRGIIYRCFQPRTKDGAAQDAVQLIGATPRTKTSHQGHSHIVENTALRLEEPCIASLTHPLVMAIRYKQRAEPTHRRAGV